MHDRTSPPTDPVRLGGGIRAPPDRLRPEAPTRPDGSGNGRAGDRIAVVASTNVYGQIAEQIGGDLVEVTSIVTNDVAGPALVRAERARPAHDRQRRPHHRERRRLRRVHRRPHRVQRQPRHRWSRRSSSRTTGPRTRATTPSDERRPTPITRRPRRTTTSRASTSTSGTTRTRWRTSPTASRPSSTSSSPDDAATFAANADDVHRRDRAASRPRSPSIDAAHGGAEVVRHRAGAGVPDRAPRGSRTSRPRPSARRSRRGRTSRPRRSSNPSGCFEDGDVQRRRHEHADRRRRDRADRRRGRRPRHPGHRVLRNAPGGPDLHLVDAGATSRR